MEDTEEQPQQQSNKAAHLAPHQFKKGVSGNPGGRAKGSMSMKEYAKRYLRDLPDEEKVDFLEGMNKKDVWEMGEGKAKQDLEVSGELVSKIVHIDE